MTCDLTLEAMACPILVVFDIHGNPDTWWEAFQDLRWTIGMSCSDKLCLFLFNFVLLRYVSIKLCFVMLCFVLNMLDVCYSVMFR